MLRRIASLIVSSLVAVGINAQNNSDPETLRPVFAAYTVEAGSSHIADTYLTPLRYDGWATTLRYDRMQAMKFSPRKWVMQLDFAVTASRTHNPAGNASIWQADIDFSWGMMRRVWQSAGFSAMVGPEAKINLGALYSARNGNNPVSAKAAVTAGVSGRLGWRGKIGRLPLTLSWQPSLPIVGTFFAPEYGELYYEIYLGDHRNLCRAAWWGNYFRLDNLVCADLHFGGTSLRVGYRNSFLSTSASHITTRIMRHTAVIGISGEWLSINLRKPHQANSHIISPL